MLIGLNIAPMTTNTLTLLATYIGLETAESDCAAILLRPWLDSLSEAERAIIDEFEGQVQTVADDALAAQQRKRVFLRVVNGPQEPTQ